MLYVGSARGVAFSTDDGATWQPLRLNLPTVAVHDLAVKDDDLVVGTTGRSLWVLDDLTPLRELTPVVAEKPAHLFAPGPAVRWRYAGGFAHTGRGAAANRPAGAALHYLFAKKPAKAVLLEVLDAQGKVVVAMKGKTDKKKGEKDDEKDETEGDDEDEDSTDWKPPKREIS